MKILSVGDMASFEKTISESDVYSYAGITGDFNPIHVNEVIAGESVFGDRIVHGLLSAGLISAVLGTKIPGEGAVYLEQNLKFERPVFIGDTVKAICEVTEIVNREKGIYRLHTFCMNQKGERVIEGYAVVQYRKNRSEEMPQIANRLPNGRPLSTFYTEDELKLLGIKKYGRNVLISRKAVLYNPELLEVGSHVRIDDFTTISGRVKLKDYIHIAQFCGLYGGEAGIYMEDFSGLSSRVAVYAVSNDYSGKSLTNPTVPSKFALMDKNEPVYICRHVIIGATSVVLPGVTVGEGSAVGSLSLVTKDVEPWGIYAGSPVKKIKDRSKNLLYLEQQLRDEAVDLYRNE